MPVTTVVVHRWPFPFIGLSLGHCYRALSRARHPGPLCFDLRSPFGFWGPYPKNARPRVWELGPLRLRTPIEGPIKGETNEHEEQVTIIGLPRRGPRAEVHQQPPAGGLPPRSVGPTRPERPRSIPSGIG